MSNAQVNYVAQYGGGNAINNTGVVQIQPTLELPGGFTPTILFSSIFAYTTTRRLIFYKSGTNTIYQVPAGKTFIATGFQVSQSITGTFPALFGHNTGVIANNSAQGAGDVYYGASATDYAMYINIPYIKQPAWHSYAVTFDSLVYPFWLQSGNNGNELQMQIVGVEV